MTGRGHGTNARYVVDRCRCDDCRQANRTYERDRARKHRKGLVPYIPADPVRTHLRGLMADGMGPVQIAKISGVAHGVIAKILYGDYARAPSHGVRRRTAQRLMAVTATLDNLADGARVDALPTRGRIAHLVEMGTTKVWIASQIAGEPRKGMQICRGETVSVATARRVRDLHMAVLSGDVVPEGRLLPSGNRLPDGWRRAYATREAAEAAVSSRYTVTPLRDKVYDRYAPRRA